MCGIAGMWGNGDILRMMDVLIHRGPDDSGIFESGPLKLGSRRLAVIDLATGRQPIHNEDQTIWVVFNGAIFNYQDIRRQLQNHHHFYTQTDTEVIVHAFEEYGIDCVKHFNGMFAIALWDGSKLYLMRDRMGEKPLYYAFRDGNFFFASEIKSILTQISAIPDIPESFYIYDAPIETQTLFKDVYTLPPGMILTYDGQNIQKTTYWSITEIEPEGKRKPESAYVDDLRSLIEDAVKLRLVSDVPIGLFLSGGLDSSIIAALARPDKVFSCRFPLGPSFDEFHYAKRMAEYIGAEHFVVTPTPEDFQQLYPQIVWHLDQPVSTASSIAEFSLAKCAKQHVTVVLGGQGADEIFGGYIRYLLMLEEERLKGMEQLKSYHSLMRYFWSPAMFDDPAARYFHLIRRSQSGSEEVKRIQKYFSPFKHLIDQMGYCDIQTTLPSLITMNDRGAAAVGLENRSPFLDHRIVEFAFRLPPELKVNEFETKSILRKAARGLVPEDVRERKDKKGLVVPFYQWLNGDLKGFADDLIQSLEKRALPFLAKQNRGEFDRQRYALVTLELWFRAFIDQPLHQMPLKALSLLSGKLRQTR